MVEQEEHNSRKDVPPESKPAPWTIRGDMYWLILRLKTLPAGIYDPLDEAILNTQAQDFRSSFGMIQIIRYTNTPVGPYDKLLVIPGAFNVPGGGAQHAGKARLRRSRIYVNSRDTTYNGRKNWNIPKHMARLEWSAPLRSKEEPRHSELKVAVFQPDGPNGEVAEMAFFRATLTPVSWVPAFPISTKWLPLNADLVQPPISAGADPILVGSETWKAARLEAGTSKAHLITGTIDEETSAGNEFWPQLKPWKLGLWLENAYLTLDAPDEFAV